MKQINSVIASALVSGLIVVGMVGIGVNALSNTASVPTSTTSAGVLINSSASRTGQRSGHREARNAQGTTNSEPLEFTQ